MSFVKFVYKFSGVKWVVESIQSVVLNYRLRLRMVPVSFKVFIWSLGVVTGASGVYVSLSWQNVLSERLTIENSVSIHAVEASNVKEKTIEEKIAEKFPENPEIMIAIAKAESHLNPLAVNVNTNGSRDIGLLQVNSVHGEDDLEMLKVDKNLEAARKIYEKQGLTAWSSFKSGAYLKFMK